MQDEIGELQRKLEERNAKQELSPTPSRKQGNEIKKPTQTSIPPTITPVSDKSLKELKEELERKLKELEKTPIPTPAIPPIPAYTFSPTPTPDSSISIPTSILSPSTIITTTSTPTITLTPTPEPLKLTINQIFGHPCCGYYNIYKWTGDNSTDAKIKSLTFEMIGIDGNPYQLKSEEFFYIPKDFITDSTNQNPLIEFTSNKYTYTPIEPFRFKGELFDITFVFNASKNAEGNYIGQKWMGDYTIFTRITDISTIENTDVSGLPTVPLIPSWVK